MSDESLEGLKNAAVVAFESRKKVSDIVLKLSQLKTAQVQLDALKKSLQEEYMIVSGGQLGSNFFTDIGLKCYTYQPTTKYYNTEEIKLAAKKFQANDIIGMFPFKLKEKNAFEPDKRKMEDFQSRFPEQFEEYISCCIEEKPGSVTFKIEPIEEGK